MMDIGALWLAGNSGVILRQMQSPTPRIVSAMFPLEFRIRSLPVAVLQHTLCHCRQAEVTIRRWSALVQAVQLQTNRSRARAFQAIDYFGDLSVRD
jgi:hypothetical protein